MPERSVTGVKYNDRSIDDLVGKKVRILREGHEPIEGVVLVGRGKSTPTIIVKDTSGQTSSIAVSMITSIEAVVIDFSSEEAEAKLAVGQTNHPSRPPKPPTNPVRHRPEGPRYAEVVGLDLTPPPPCAPSE